METKSTKGKSVALANSKKANGQTDPMAKSKQSSDWQQVDDDYNSDSEEYSSEPKTIVANTKSKVNWLKFTFRKLYSFIFKILGKGN